MKHLITLGAALLAGFAIADSVESTTTFGVLKISAPTNQVAISAPWVNAGYTTGDEVVYVKDLVKTSNLTAGDQLLLYTPSTGAYTGWLLSDSKTWSGATTVTAVGTTTAGTDTTTITRGSALIVILNGYNDMTDKNVYLYGQYVDTTVDSWTFAAGQSTLFAPINTTSTAIDLNSAYTWSGVTGGTTGDMIQVQGSDGLVVKLYYRSGSWQGFNYSTGDWSADYAKIQPGMGAWYVAKSSAVTATKKAAN